VEQEEAELPVIAQRAIVASRGNPNPLAEIELPSPGTYLVDLAYPNGRHTRRTINVEADKPYRFLLQDRRYASRSASVPSEQRTRVFAAAASPNELEVRRLRLPARMPLDLLGTELSASALHVLRRNAAPIFASSAPEQVQVIPLPSVPEVPLTTLLERSWLVASCAGEFPTLVAYPDHWLPVESTDAFRLLARRKDIQGPASKKWSVSLELIDATYGALIEYLTRRDVQSGETVSSSMQAQALQALYEKMENPVAGAAGAYLMALGDLSTSDRRDWMRNLYTRFDWLPDGAIAWGWRLLREGERGTAAWSDARAALLEACARGLPYYTVGLHILVDALTALSMSDRADIEVSRMLAAATVADSACVRTEPFTTLQVSRLQEMFAVK